MKKYHKLVTKLQQDLAEKKIDRRVFLRYATLLGVSLASARTMVQTITGSALADAHTHANLTRGGTIRLSMGLREVENAHALNWLESGNITNQVVETLTRIDQNNITIPHLCQGWEASEDLRSWTFSLRPNAYWRKGDNRPLIADEVIWNFKRILDPATGSSSVGLMSYLLQTQTVVDSNGQETQVTSLWDANAFEKVDDFTVRMNLKIPYAFLAEDLFFYCNTMLDPEENGVFGVGANGTGPFELVEYDLGRGIAVLQGRPIDDYYGFGPYLDTLIFNDLGDDPQAQISALASQQVDGLYRVDNNLRRVIELFPFLNIHSVNTSATAIFQIKVKEKPFDDPRVRLAMRYAMDSDIVLNLSLQNQGLPGEHHFVCPIHPGYAPLPKMERDPERARGLLAEAGYPDGIDIEIACKSDPQWELSAVQVVAQQYAEAGITMKINLLPRSQFWDVWDKVTLGFVEWAHRPIELTVLNLGFRSNAPWNAPEYENPEFDRLLDEAGAILDGEQRSVVIEKIQRLLQQDGPFCQPCWVNNLTAMNQRVQNFHIHPQLFFFGNQLGVSS